MPLVECSVLRGRYGLAGTDNDVIFINPGGQVPRPGHMFASIGGAM